MTGDGSGSDRRGGGGRALTTSALARDVGIHPNTVRIYEALGYLPPVPRSRAGYRRFGKRHLEHLRLARLLRGTTWPGRTIHRSAIALIVRAARDGPAAAVPAALEHLETVHAEQAVAAEAQRFAAAWLDGSGRDDGCGGSLPGVRVPEAVRRTGVSPDTLRSWERSGLLRIGRDPRGVRTFTPADLRRATVVRALRGAGYSPTVILRMLCRADAGEGGAAVGELAAPGIEPDLVRASDQWVATLADHEARARGAIDLICAMADESSATLH